MKFKTMAAGAAAVALVFMAGPALASGSAYDVSVNGSTAAGTHAIEAYTITDVYLSLQFGHGRSGKHGL